MSLLLITYLLNSFFLVVLGVLFLKKYHNIGGVFFLIFTLSTAFWFIFFILSYSFTENLYILEIFIKLSYFLSIITLSSFVLFLIYFNRNKQGLNSYIFILFWFISVFLGYLYIYTGLIVDGLYFDTNLQDWYENPGSLHFLHIGMSLLFIPISIILGGYRFKHVGAIDKKRLQYIFIGVLIFIACCFLFLLIFPLLGFKGQMDRYISFFFIPFIIGVYYSIRRYDFLDFKLTLVNIILFGYSLLSAFLIVHVIQKYSLGLNSDFRDYWGFSDSSSFIEFFIGISSFLVIFNFSKRKLSLFFTQTIFSEEIEKMKGKIPFILNVPELNRFLELNFKEKLNINFAKINLGEDSNTKKIQTFFDENKSFKFILLDLVFLEENKKKLSSIHSILTSIKVDAYVLFPLKTNLGKTTGLGKLGGKPLNDPFLTSELNILLGFTDFLSSHLKYIDIYKQIQELTFSLDKKVDEKTIEYNNLLNKQKEFIAYVGHEIKNPITNALFLTDSLRDTTADLGSKEAIEDSGILYDELIKVSKLVKHIFSSEKFDLGKVKLFTEKINLSDFLEDEARGFSHKFPYIDFNVSVSANVYSMIDETQFRQVIQNLVNNAIKFIDNKNPKILLSLKEKEGKIYINIEDNGTGFKEVDVTQVFAKYATGGGGSIGLGMGLYLCKKIVELHGGNISAGNSDALGGANFCIQL